MPVNTFYNVFWFYTWYPKTFSPRALNEFVHCYQ